MILFLRRDLLILVDDLNAPSSVLFPLDPPHLFHLYQVVKDARDGSEFKAPGDLVKGRSFMV